MKNKSKRWANPVEFEKYATGIPPEVLCKLLHRSRRTIHEWQIGRRPIPAWAPEVLRMKHIESEQYRRQLDYMRMERKQQATRTH